MVYVILHCTDDASFWYEGNQRRLCADKACTHTDTDKFLYIYLMVRRVL